MTSQAKSDFRPQKSITSSISELTEKIEDVGDTKEKKKEEVKYVNIIMDQRHGPKRVLFIPYDIFCETTLMVVAYFSTFTSAAAILGDYRILEMKQKLRSKDNTRYFIVDICMVTF